MSGFENWPAPILRRWLLSTAAGPVIFLIGLAGRIALHDPTLLTLSTLLASCTLEQMKQYFIEHQHAREIGDKKMMEKIEYHLTYINLHYECGLLATGQYDKLPEVIKNW